jgi:glycogen synthase
VHRIGGLADTVIDETTSPGHGTGFSFEGATVEGLVGACLAATELRRADEVGWANLVDRGMAVDFDWDTGSAPRYLEAYRRAAAIRIATRSDEHE